MDAWNTFSFPFGAFRPIFRGKLVLLVSGAGNISWTVRQTSEAPGVDGKPSGKFPLNRGRWLQELVFPKNPRTLQWKGLNLYSRGVFGSSKWRHFWGVRILRVVKNWMIFSPPPPHKKKKTGRGRNVSNKKCMKPHTEISLILSGLLYFFLKGVDDGGAIWEN